MSAQIESLMNHQPAEKRDELLAMCERLFEISPDGFLFVNPDGRIAYINPAYCYQLDIKRSDAIGKPVVEVVKNTALVARMESRDFTVERNVLSFETSIPTETIITNTSNDKYVMLYPQCALLLYPCSTSTVWRYLTD